MKIYLSKKDARKGVIEPPKLPDKWKAYNHGFTLFFKCICKTNVYPIADDRPPALPTRNIIIIKIKKLFAYAAAIAIKP